MSSSSSSAMVTTSPCGGTAALPTEAQYEAMEDSPERRPESNAPEIFATIASCGCLGRGTVFKERSYAPLTPVEEGLLADLTRSAAVDNNITEDTMNGLLVEWWSLVTTDVDSSAPELPRDERWKSVGFQSARPSSDFRTGPHALLCMVIAGRAYSPEFREMVAGSDGYCGAADDDHNRFHYPFAATAINVHFMLLHYLGVVDGFSLVVKDAIAASGHERKVFASALAVTSGAFEDLFTATCMAVHSHWTRMVRDEEATLMDFQESLAYGLSRAANALGKASPVQDLPSWHRVLNNICISFSPSHTASVTYPV